MNMIKKAPLFLPILLSLTLHAQEGDKRDKEGVVQKDPIPAHLIPPSPLLNQQEALDSFQIQSGFIIEPLVDESLVHMPVALQVDSAGRVWIAEMRSYMPNLDGEGEDTPNGRIKVLEDTDGDSYLDKATIFIDNLVLPRALAVTEDGCLFTDGISLNFIKRDGIKPTGKAEVVDADYATGGNPEHQANALTYAHNNWYYSAKSLKRYRRVDGKWISEPTRMRGQWGMDKDNLGRLFFNSNSVSFLADQFPPEFFRSSTDFWKKVSTGERLTDSRVYPIHMTPGVNRAYNPGTLDTDGKLIRSTAASGIAVYRDTLFPSQFHNSIFAGETVGDLIQNVVVERDTYNKPSGQRTTGTEEFLASTDEWFLPCSTYSAPDGSIWVIDMNFGLTQHRAYMTSYLRSQYESRNLDNPAPNNGRIYRIKAADAELRKLPILADKSPKELVSYLAHPNGATRDMAQRILVERAATSTVSELRKLVTTDAANYGWLHAAWTLHGLNALDTETIRHLLDQDDPAKINAALEFSTDGEHQTLNQVIGKLSSSPQTLHAHLKALAHFGHIDQALALISTHGEQARIHEAYLAGLSKKELTALAKDPSVNQTFAQLLQGKKPGKNSKKLKPLKGKAKASFQRGKAVYAAAACNGCHGAEGEGVDYLGPPLVDSEWVTKDEELLTKILLKGLQGPLKVNGKDYSPPAAMPAMGHFSDQQLADVMTYIRYSWGNRAKPVTPNTVQKVRTQTAGQTQAYTASEIQP